MFRVNALKCDRKFPTIFQNVTQFHAKKTFCLSRMQKNSHSANMYANVRK